MRRMLIAAALLTALLACGKGDKGAAVAPPADPAALLNPAAPALTAQAPATYRAKFETSAGDFTVEVTRAWAPLGADRLYNLIKNGFYDGDRFFRVVPGFVVQFGINGTPAVSTAWKNANIADDPVTQHNTTGTIVFATAGPNTRTTQLFINYSDNFRLDQMGFAPMGKVVQGMDVVQKIYPGYGQTPNQDLIQSQGNTYLSQGFPQLDFIKKATIQ
ncbi:MAG TPA: peptidylprolyl isomerase [Gemmatimonadales bacterium]|nr:peptidylprolyl isomerase [Gemmatimonadales bacterium]